MANTAGGPATKVSKDTAQSPSSLNSQWGWGVRGSEVTGWFLPISHPTPGTSWLHHQPDGERSQSLQASPGVCTR